jgi:hypothetical protein
MMHHLIVHSVHRISFKVILNGAMMKKKTDVVVSRHSIQ